MIKDKILNKIKSIRDSHAYIHHYALNQSLPESVYFYTFHKCASTLFSSYVLKSVTGLYHMDYAAQIYSGRRSSEKKLSFKKNGFIYGPIRISAGVQGPVGERLVKPTTKHNFIRDKIAIFFIRDPRDILISSYYSFGFTHGLSGVDAIRERQLAAGRSIREMTLDEYVLDSVDEQIDYFRILYDLSRTCERSSVLRYEDMINDFDRFSEQLSKYVSLDAATIQELYQRSRPQKTEDTKSHRRSGQVGGFREKLEESTIKAVNKKLADTLSLFEYNA
ncbi:MAG: hypothetical protein ACO37W_01040 [Prochlorotrichaceae cyanobacterium]